jgi:hypothetical protein
MLISMNKSLLSFRQFINEGVDITPSFEKFSENRLNGAADITANAEKKGGDAMLTYHHFVVKLPYYQRAAEGTLSLSEARAELQMLMTQLVNGTTGDVTIEQVEFQELVGKIEVLGELIIKSKS